MANWTTRHPRWRHSFDSVADQEVADSPTRMLLSTPTASIWACFELQTANYSSVQLHDDELLPGIGVHLGESFHIGRRHWIGNLLATGVQMSSASNYTIVPTSSRLARRKQFHSDVFVYPLKGMAQ